MSLSIMGSVNTYTKTMKLQTQWNLKQQSGDYTSHKKSLDEWISTAQETLKKSRRGLYGNQDDDEEGNKKLNNIMQKIYAGKKLTQKERQYLQAKNPQAYEKLRASEQEQKAFEKKLRLCRTKEEVQRLKMTQLASSMAIVGSVQNNSKIPNLHAGKNALRQNRSQHAGFCKQRRIQPPAHRSRTGQGPQGGKGKTAGSQKAKAGTKTEQTAAA